MSVPAIAQDTSSSISGRVLDASGQPLAGATVEIVHAPTGTTKTTITDANGRYAAQGLRVGGPFDVKVAKGGQQTEQDNVYLQLAQDTAVNLTVGAAVAAKNLTGVTVSANALSQTFTPENKGISTNISRRELEAAPTPGRSIQNIVRMDPRVVISDRARGEISAIGQNSRYNNITVDSVSANDPFGLNANGLPTLGTPISQDTIEEYNISTANYDVGTRRGVGANINAVTKSGTNDFHGSVYYAFQNRDDMIGDNPAGARYAGFARQWTAGGTVGGPIIKDKLFFFASAEKSTQIGSGSPYGPADSSAATPIANLTSAQVQAVRDAAAQKWGMNNLGSVGGGNSNLLDKRYLAKIDWNITNNHRASFTYSETKEEKPVISGSTTKLVLSSGWYKTKVDNKSYALHFYDDWSDIFSSDTTLSYADFDQKRGPNGVAMPDVTVYPATFNGPAVEFGTESSSQANVLKVKTLNAAWAGTLYLGDHTVKGGFDYEHDKYYDLFLQNLFGSYTFEDLRGSPNTGLQNFLAGNYYQYRYYRPADGLSLADTAAAYRLNQWGIFLQDTWQVNSNLSVQYGFRVDIPLMSDKPLYNGKFAAAFKEPDGTPRNNQVTINGNRVIQPRVSFNYTFDTEHMTQLRGGAGLFVTNPPGVWIGNIFSNSGMTQVQYNCGPTQPKPCNTNLPAFSPNPSAQNNGAAGGQMTVNTVEPGFRIPSAWKMSLGFDKELPWYGLIATADYEHIKQRDAIWYQNLNLGAPTAVLPDGRLSYYAKPTMDPKAAGQSSRANANPAFSDGVINLANTSRGKADSLTLALKKPFADDWQAMVGFAWSRSTEVNPGTSSVARSNYINNYVRNPNENVASVSNYSIPRRVIASLTWQHRFFGDYVTSASAFYDGHSAAPYSWVFGNDANGDGVANDLVYIPRPGDVEFGYRDPKGNVVPIDPQLVQQFYSYVQKNDYLKEHQGQIARRNGDRAGWLNQIDLSFSQEIPGIFKGNKGEIRFDIYNFTNMLNKKWGIEKRVNFPGGRNLADFAGVDPTTGKYIYDITCGGKVATCTSYIQNGGYSPQAVPTYINNNDDLAQRWSVQLTLKYKF